MSKSGPSKKAPAHSPAKAVDPQLAAFEEAVQLVHRRELAAAMPLFVEAGKGRPAPADVKIDNWN